MAPVLERLPDEETPSAGEPLGQSDRLAEPKRTGARRAWPGAAFVLVCVFQGWLTFYFERPEAFLRDEPVLGGDFDTHFGQAARFVDSMRGFQKTWSYDVALLAGRPAGVLFDCDNKAWNLWTYFCTARGLSVARSFNLFVIAASLSLPFVVFAGARLLRFSTRAAILCCFCLSLLWFFDSQIHYFWWIGMITWVYACHFALIPFGAFYRYCRTPSVPFAAATALSLALSLLIHPFTFFVLVVPMGALFVRAWPRFERSERVLIYAVVVFAVLANAFWLWPVVKFRHYFLPSPFFSQAPFATLLHDFLELAMDPNDTAMFMRTALRFIGLGLGIGGLLTWHRVRDDRFLPFGLATFVFIVEAYLGRYTPLTAQIQPYRYIVPATILASLAAIAFVIDPSTRSAVRAAGAPVYVLLATLGLSSLQFVVHDVLFFFPEWIPKQQGRGPEAVEIVTPTGYPRNYDHRHPLPLPTGDPLVAWFRAHRREPGRVLVENDVLAERLAAEVSEIEVMGGIRERNEVHTLTNFFRRYPERQAPPPVFRAYLERYAVRWVVLETRRPLPAGYELSLRQVGMLPELAIYEVPGTPSFFAAGHGELRALRNRIQVWRTVPGEPLILRYHFLETLVCEPGCRVERFADPEDPVGFLRIPAPHPSSFFVRNAY